MEQDVISKRDALLLETAEWSEGIRRTTVVQREYIDALNNIEQQDGFPNDVIWPTKP
jgi:hypothetical protein